MRRTTLVPPLGGFPGSAAGHVRVRPRWIRARATATLMVRPPSPPRCCLTHPTPQRVCNAQPIPAPSRVPRCLDLLAVAQRRCRPGRPARPGDLFQPLAAPARRGKPALGHRRAGRKTFRQARRQSPRRPGRPRRPLGNPASGHRRRWTPPDRDRRCRRPEPDHAGRRAVRRALGLLGPVEHGNEPGFDRSCPGGHLGRRPSADPPVHHPAHPGGRPARGLPGPLDALLPADGRRFQRHGVLLWRRRAKGARCAGRPDPHVLGRHAGRKLDTPAGTRRPAHAQAHVRRRLAALQRHDPSAHPPADRRSHLVPGRGQRGPRPSITSCFPS